MINWNIEKLDLKKKIAIEKLETQRIKTKNFDLTRKISDLKRQIRESMTISSISVVSAAPTVSVASAIAKSVVTITTNYRPRDNNSKKSLNGKNLDAYSSWIFTIKKKSALMLSCTRMSRRRWSTLFFKWSISFSMPCISELSMSIFFFFEIFFKEIQNYFKIIYLIKDAKKKLRKISINKNETITKYYHRLFKFWQRVKISIENQIETFKNIFKLNVVVFLLNKDFDSLKTLLYETRKIEQSRKELNQKFAKQNFQKFAKSIFSIFSASRDFNKITIITFSISIAMKSKTTAPSTAFAVNKNSNSNFESIFVKSAEWIETWHDETLHFSKLNDAEREKLSRKNRCWSCRKSKHRDRNLCCIKQKTSFSRVAVVNDNFESSNSKKE